MTLRYELVIPILQIRKMRHREVKWLDHHLTTPRFTPEYFYVNPLHHFPTRPPQPTQAGLRSFVFFQMPFSLLYPVPSQPHPETDLLGQAEGRDAQGPETAQHGEDSQAEVVVG